MKNKLNELEKLSNLRIKKSHFVWSARECDSYTDDEMFSFKDVRI